MALVLILKSTGITVFDYLFTFLFSSCSNMYVTVDGQIMIELHKCTQKHTRQAGSELQFQQDHWLTCNIDLV